MTKRKSPDDMPPLMSVNIQSGAPLMISHVSADGYTNLGRGKATLRRIGNARLITIQTNDGEIRILVL
jgi:hypothetical protein